MHIVALKLLGLVGLLVPLVAGAWVLWRRAWRRGSPSETLLAALLTVPFVLIVQITLLSSAPFDRPLDYLPISQGALSGVGLLAAVVCRRDLTALLGGAIGGFREVWSAGDSAQRQALLLGAVALSAAGAYGAWNTPWSVDEFSYHIPQAVQPLHDGRLGPVKAPAVWADSYPRGVALLYYWTLRLTGTDAGFHPVNATFGAVFVLATWVAARRQRLARGWPLVAAGLAPTAPIFLYLATIGYIDLSVGGVLAAAIALALPERDGGWSRGSLIAMLVAMTLALWMKFPPIALCGLLLMYRLILALFTRRKVDASERTAPGPRLVVALAAVMLLLASAPYLNTWRRYGSPVYPLRLRVGPAVVFDGPMDTSAFGRMNAAPLPERFGRFWFEWWTETNADSPGSFGLLFAAVVPWCVLLALLLHARASRLGWLLLVVVFASALAIPEHHVPRYALYILLPGMMCVASVGEALSRWRLGGVFAQVLFYLAIANVVRVGYDLNIGLRWQRSFQLPMFTELRNRVVLDQVGRAQNEAPAAETRRALFGLMKPGETVATAVLGTQGLLYDAKYSYRVEHRPARPWPYPSRPTFFADIREGEPEARAWLSGLKRDAVAAAMVYRDSAEATVLAEPGSGFRKVYEQSPEAGEHVVVIYRRESP